MSLNVVAKFRLKTFKRFFSAQNLSFWLIALAGLVVIVSVLGAAGWRFAPGLMASPDTTFAPSMRSSQVEGRYALELAFWLAALLSSVVSFRVMEAMFRRSDVRALRALPIDSTSIFFERLAVVIFESLGLGILVSVFFAPIALLNPLIGGLSMLLVVAGALSSGLLTMGAVMWVGSQFGSPDGVRIPGDAYGSSGGAFIYAPGAALMCSLVALLFLQLALGEVLLAGHLTRAFGLGLGIVGALNFFAILLAFKEFRTSYFRVAAWFHEADSTGFSAVAEHQVSSFSPLKWERWIPEWARLVSRKTHVQALRINMVPRWVMFTILCGSLLLHFFMSLPTWVLVAIPAMAFALGNPWKRLWDIEVGPFHSQNLPVTDFGEVVGRLVYITYECFRLALPYSVALAAYEVFKGTFDPYLLLAPLSVVFQMAFLLLVDRLRYGNVTVRILPPYLAVMWAILAAWSLAGAAILGISSVFLLLAAIPRKSGRAFQWL